MRRKEHQPSFERPAAGCQDDNHGDSNGCQNSSLSKEHFRVESEIKAPHLRVHSNLAWLDSPQPTDWTIGRFAGSIFADCDLTVARPSRLRVMAASRRQSHV